MTRLLIAVAIGGLISLMGTQFLIGWLTRHKIGQPIREDGPEGHHTKAGTPTMGGAAIVIGAAAAYTISDLLGRYLHPHRTHRDADHPPRRSRGLP